MTSFGASMCLKAVSSSTSDAEPSPRFDESIFLFGEDQDLCRRLRRGGWEIWYSPVGEVRHLSGHSWRQLSDRGRRHFREARYRELRRAAGTVDAELYRALVWARDATHKLGGGERR